MEPTDKTILTPKDVVKMGICRSKAYALFNRADFPSFRIGKNRYITAENFFAYLNKLKDEEGQPDEI